MSILEKTKVIDRVHYDPSILAHRASLKSFLTKNKWTQHFVVEENVHNLPYKLMVQTLLWFMSKE